MRKINVAVLFMSLFCSCLTIRDFPNAINQRGKEGKVGLWIVQNDTTGHVIVQRYLDDLPNGKYVEYHSNGRIAITGSFKKGKKDGVWKMYSSSGSLSSVTKYKKGKVIQNKVFNLSW